MSTDSLSSEMVPNTFTLYDVYQYVFMLFGISGMFLDVITITTVARFKKLHYANYVFLANWAIVDILWSITGNLHYLFPNLDRYDRTNMQITLQISIIFAVFIVIFDWMLAAFFSRTSENFRKYYKHVMALYWLLTGFFIGVSLVAFLLFLTSFVLLYAFLALNVCVFVLHAWKVVQYCRNRPVQYPTFSLDIATICVIIMWIGFYNDTWENRWFGINSLICLILDCVAVSTPLVIFIMLSVCSADFKECLQQFCKHTQKDADNYYQPSTKEDLNVTKIHLPDE